MINTSFLSPIDSRYALQVTAIRDACSDYAFIKARIRVEIEWLLSVAIHPQITGREAMNQATQKKCQTIIDQFSSEKMSLIHDYEAITKHDVKAIEHYIKAQMQDSPLTQDWVEWIHWSLTSEDVNNLSYGLLLLNARKELQKKLQQIIFMLVNDAEKYADLPMLSRTHGQPATPTTLGKELANFAYRLAEQHQQLTHIPFFGKVGGAVGNLNAHIACCPDYQWNTHVKKFVESLGLQYHPYTTQIEPHDSMIRFFHALTHTNHIILGLCRDMWMYISLGYFCQYVDKNAVGSSTMPHKVNPIFFENAEGNVGLANSLLVHFCEKLPISRWQRDLSDSTVMRNIGLALGYVYLAYQNCQRGLEQVSADRKYITKDLDKHWELLAEPIQTVLRWHGVANAYEQLKTLCRGKNITQEIIQEFIKKMSIPQEAKVRLLNLTPHSYIGSAFESAIKIRETVNLLIEKPSMNHKE